MAQVYNVGMTVYDTQRPYAASYVIFKRGNTAAFVLRQNTNWMNGYFGLIAGKVEDGESFTMAAIREAKEEAGITLALQQLRQVLVCHRNSDNNSMIWVDTFFEVTDWEGEVTNAEPHMHAAVEWLDMDNLPDNVIPSLTAMLKAYRAGETYYEHNWS